MRHFIAVACLAPIAFALIGCGGSMPKLPKRNFSEEQASNPLGPSYLLFPLPSEDTNVLGRILTAPPEPGRSLDEISRPNPCAEKLTVAQTVAQSAEFNDARELKASGSTKAMLGTFGFSADAEHATHFVYKLATDKRVGRTDTTEYTACCQQKGCGYGFISALVHGEGEYATGEESHAGGTANVMMVGSAQGQVSLRTLHRRKVRGYVAAVVSVTDASKVKPTDPLGLAAEAGVQLESNNDSLRQIADREKVVVSQVGATYAFSTAAGPLTENEFAERYRQVTGSDELDPFDHRRNKPELYVSASAFGLSASFALLGTLLATRSCTAEDVEAPEFLFFYPRCWKSSTFPNTPGSKRKSGIDDVLDPNGTYYRAGWIVLGMVGFAGLIPSGIWFFSQLGKYDGKTTDHDLSYDDAIVYRDKYNRALIKRTHKRVNSGALELKIRPMFGSTVGIQGTF